MLTSLLLPEYRACRLAQGEAPCKFGPQWWWCTPRRPPTSSPALSCLRAFADWIPPLLQEYFKNDTLALIGYGSQGHGQGLNLRDNGLNVIVGVRKNGQSWKDALADGWVPGKNLFEVDEAIGRGTIVMNLLSDAAQSETWPAIKPQLTKGKVRAASSQASSSQELNPPSTPLSFPHFGLG